MKQKFFFPIFSFLSFIAALCQLIPDWRDTAFSFWKVFLVFTLIAWTFE